MDNAGRALYAPVFLQVALTFTLLFWMGWERYKAVRDRTYRPPADAGQRAAWPERAGVVSNAFHNQLEIPMLFYAAAAFALLANAVDSVTVILAWIFVLSRIAHAFIYTTYNAVPHRFAIYLIGVAAVLIMWIRLALHLSLAST